MTGCRKLYKVRVRVPKVQRYFSSKEYEKRLRHAAVFERTAMLLVDVLEAIDTTAMLCTPHSASYLASFLCRRL